MSGRRTDSPRDASVSTACVAGAACRTLDSDVQADCQICTRRHALAPASPFLPRVPAIQADRGSSAWSASLHSLVETIGQNSLRCVGRFKVERLEVFAFPAGAPGRQLSPSLGDAALEQSGLLPAPRRSAGDDRGRRPPGAAGRRPVGGSSPGYVMRPPSTRAQGVSACSVARSGPMM